jgi:hypothetical protein
MKYLPYSVSSFTGCCISIIKNRKLVSYWNNTFSGWNTGSHHITVDEWRGEWSFLDKKEKCYFNKKYVTPNKTVSFSDS